MYIYIYIYIYIVYKRPIYTPSNIGPSNFSSLLNIKLIKNVTLP